MNLPNQLTASRFVLAIVLFVLISLGQWWWCVIVFVLAAITDFLDGYLARRLNLGSTLGRNLDPLVDKILICGAFIFLMPWADSGLQPWMVAVVVSRELLVTSLRTFIETRGGNFGADWAGKLKMWLQCATLIAVFVTQAMHNVDATSPLPLIRDVIIYGMVLSTVQSGLQYLWKATVLLRQE